MLIVSYQKEEIRHLAELTNANIIGFGETDSPDSSVLNNVMVIQGCDFIRLIRSRKGGDVTYFIKHSVANSYKANVESIFTEIYQAKSKPFIVDILYTPPGIIDFVNYIDQILLKD